MSILTPTLPPNSGIQHKQENTTAYVNENCLGDGTLYVSESLTVWIQDLTGLGFSVEYPTITMHAISRDRSSFESECLFAVLDVALEGTNPSDVDGDYASSTELRFVPLDVSSLTTIFQAMSACQRLHPDQQSSDEGEYNNTEVDDEDDDDELDFNGLPEADRVIYQHGRVNGSTHYHDAAASSLVHAIHQLTTNGGDDDVAMDVAAEADQDQQFEDAD